MKPANVPINWMLDSNEPWTVYRCKLDLLQINPQSEEAEKAYTAMENNPLIQALMKQANTWGEEPFKRHNDASYPIYALSTLADFGLTRKTPEIQFAAERVLEHISEDGGLLTLTNIPKAFGGSGKDTWSWILCDMPTLAYSLSAFGYSEDPRILKAMELINSTVQDNGWRCVASQELGKFHGPGKSDHPCPVVNIYALKAMSLYEKNRNSEAAAKGIEMLLSHWEQRGKQKYYLFGIGTDFRKLKYPYVWYNILHVLETLSRFPQSLEDPRYTEMVQELENLADSQGRFTPNSMYRSWKDWSFANKKQQSAWITFLANRIFIRSYK